MSLNPFRVLRHRNFRLFWWGQTLSLIGTWMQSMAQGWLAFALSRNAFFVGAVAAAQSLPVLLFSLHAGVLVDRANKLRLVTICQMLLGLEAGALWLLTWTGHITIHGLIALAAINGMISSVEIPARQSLVIELVGRDDEGQKCPSGDRHTSNDASRRHENADGETVRNHELLKRVNH